MKILMVTSPTEFDDYFPMNLWVLDLPFNFEVTRDPYGSFLPKEFTDEQREIIEQLFDNAERPTFTINEMLPEWVEWGYEHAKGISNGETPDSDQLAAAVWLQYSIMTISNCAAVYDLTWF